MIRSQNKIVIYWVLILQCQFFSSCIAIAKSVEPKIDSVYTKFVKDRGVRYKDFRYYGYNDTGIRYSEKDIRYKEFVKNNKYEEMQQLIPFFDIQTEIKTKNKDCVQISPQTYDDLNLFPNQYYPDKPTIFSDFANATSTISGKVGLLEMLANPLYDLEKLQQRQQVIELLSTNDELFNELEAILKNVGVSENSLLYFLGRKNKSNDDDLGKYFDEKIISSGGSLGNNAAWYAGLAGRALLPGIFLAYALYNLYKIGSETQGIIPYTKALTFEFNHEPKQPVRFLNITLALLSLGIMKVSYRLLVSPRLEMGKRIQSYVDNVTNFINSTQKISDLVNKNSAMSAIIPDHKNIFCELNDICEFTSKGEAFKQFDVISENADKQFAEALRFIGRVDALMAVVKVLKSSRGNHQRWRYSIPKFLKTENNTPYINAKKFCHPSLSPKSAITNDIELGKDFRNIVLTGTIASGKTAWVQGLALVVVLAQTFGVVPASEAILTPFSLIVAAVKSSADIIGTSSLFQDDMHKMLNTMQQIKSLPADKLAFYVTDEPLKGSNAEDCAKIGHGVIEDLGSNGNALLVVATHHLAFAEIAQTNLSFRNYKTKSTHYSAEVEDSLYDGGVKTVDHFIHSYKVVPGIEKCRYCVFSD